MMNISKIMRSLPTCDNEKVISILKLRTIKKISREAQAGRRFFYEMTTLVNNLPNVETTLKSNIYKDKEELLKDSSYAKCTNFLKAKNENDKIQQLNQ